MEKLRAVFFAYAGKRQSPKYAYYVKISTDYFETITQKIYVYKY